MKKNKPLILFFMLTVLFFLSLLFLIFLKKNKLKSDILDIVFIVILVTLAICKIMTIIHLAMNMRGIPIKYQDSSLVIKENEGCIFFIPCTCDSEELSKIDVDSNILEFVSHDTDGDDDKLLIVQNRGLFTNQELTLSISGEYKIIDKINCISQMNSSGLCVFVKEKNVQSDMDRMEEYIDTNKFLHGFTYIEMYNKTLFLRRKCLKFIESKDKANASLCLSSIVDVKSGITLYDCLLQQLFEFCPNNKKYIFPKPDFFSGRNNNDDYFWINSDNGKIALFLLRNFPPSRVIQRNQIYGDSASGLNKKVAYIQDYIDKNPKMRCENCLDEVFSLLRDVACSQYRVNLYNNLFKNYSVDGETEIRDLILQDLDQDIYRYIFTIASYQDDSPSNKFIRELLMEKTDEDFVNSIKTILNNYRGPMIKTSPDYKRLKIDDILKVLSLSSRTRCTVSQLVKRVREYIVKRYTQNLMPFYSEVCSVELGSVEDIVILEDQVMLPDPKSVYSIAGASNVSMQK